MDPIDKILLGAGAAVVAVIAIAFLWLVIANAHLKAELAGAQATGTACHLANDAFADVVARQNRAVAALRARRAQAGDAAARKIARTYDRRAAAMGAAQPKGDACRAADALIDAYLADRS